MATLPHTKDARWLTPAQVADRLGVGQDKVYAWIRSGELPAINVAKRPYGRPTYKVTPAALASFEERRTVGPCKAAGTKASRRYVAVKDYFAD